MTEPTGSTLYDDFYLDDKWKTEGAWIQTAGAEWAFQIIYCGPLNRETQRAVAEIYASNSGEIRQNEDGELVADEELEARITREFLIEHAVKGWKNIRDREGKILKFSKAALRAKLEEMPALVDWLWRRCQQKSYFEDAVDLATKN